MTSTSRARARATAIATRPMCADDIDAILRIQVEVYSQQGDLLLERPEVFLDRMRLAPSTCLIAEDAQQVHGYMISHPWTPALPPTLDITLNTLPAGANQWFLHDCAIVPAAQGRGVAAALLTAGRQQAARLGLQQAMLVALGSARSYWERHGYAAAAPTPALQAKLQAYGEGAVLMQAPLLAA